MTNHVNNHSIIPPTDVIQLTLTLKMTTAQVVEMSVIVNYSPIGYKGLVNRYRVGGGGWGWRSGAFGNVVDKRYMAHPLPSAKK